MRRAMKAAAVGVLSAALAAGAATAPGYAHDNVTHSGSVAQHQHRYDARTVFRGVFFGDGPLAASLPYTRSVSNVPRSTAAENVVMDRIETAHPGLIESTYRELTSGSLVRTRAAIKDGRKAVATAASAVHERMERPGQHVIVYYVAVQARTYYVLAFAHEQRTAPGLDAVAYQVRSALSTSRRDDQ